MTILEQPINPDEIQLTLNTVVMLCTVLAIAVLVTICAYKYVDKLESKMVKGEISTGSCFVRFILAIVAMLFIPIFSVFPINTWGHKVPGLDHFAVPISKPNLAPPFTDRQLFVDAYRDEINNAVADKLSDYNMSECSFDKDYKSLLCPDGRYGDKIAATRDGKTYTLTPHLGYDTNTSTVTLNVDIEEGYHIDD